MGLEPERHEDNDGDQRKRQHVTAIASTCRLRLPRLTPALRPRLCRLLVLCSVRATSTDVTVLFAWLSQVDAQAQMIPSVLVR